MGGCQLVFPVAVSAQDFVVSKAQLRDFHSLPLRLTYEDITSSILIPFVEDFIQHVLKEKASSSIFPTLIALTIAISSLAGEQEVPDLPT